MDAEKQASISTTTSTTTSTRDDVDQVEFFLNKKISDEDLDILMLYLENKRKSGGSDTSSFSVDLSRRRLTVVYLDADAKKRVLERQVKKSINFISYYLACVLKFQIIFFVSLSHINSSLSY